MDSSVLGVAAAAAAVVGFLVYGSQQKAKNRAMAASIEPALREKGALTLPGVTEALGMKGVMARGKIAMALNEMAAQGKVEIVPAPEGTPQLEKVNHIKYRLRG